MNKITAFLAVFALTAAATPSASAGSYRIGTSNSGAAVYVAVRAVAGASAGDAAEASCLTAVDDLIGDPARHTGCREKPANSFRQINGLYQCNRWENWGFYCDYNNAADEADCNTRLRDCDSPCAIDEDHVRNQVFDRQNAIKHCSRPRPETYF